MFLLDMYRQLLYCKLFVTVWTLLNIFFPNLNFLFLLLLSWLYLTIIVMVHLNVVDQHVLIIEHLITKRTFQFRLLIKFLKRALRWLLSVPLLPSVRIVMSCFFLFIFRRFVFGPTTNEEPNHLLFKRHFLFLFLRFGFLLIFFYILTPIEKFHILSNFFVLDVILDRLAVMHVVKPMGHTQMHLAFWALEIIDISELRFTPLGLAMRGPPIFHLRFLKPLILPHLAFTSLNMFVPNVLGGDP